MTAGEGAAAAPLACLLRSEPGQCCLDTCPGRRSQPQRAGGRVSLSQWHTWQICVLLQWVQKHTHTHTLGTWAMYACTCVGNMPSAIEQIHAHMNTAQTGTHPCKHAAPPCTHTLQGSHDSYTLTQVCPQPRRPPSCIEIQTQIHEYSGNVPHTLAHTHTHTHTPGNTYHAHIPTDTPQGTHSTNTHRSRHRHTLLHREHHRNMYSHTPGNAAPREIPTCRHHKDIQLDRRSWVGQTGPHTLTYTPPQ